MGSAHVDKALRQPAAVVPGSCLHRHRLMEKLAPEEERGWARLRVEHKLSRLRRRLAVMAGSETGVWERAEGLLQSPAMAPVSFLHHPRCRQKADLEEEAERLDWAAVAWM